MMPAQIVPGTVPVPADAGAQFFYFVNKLIAGKVLQVFVHGQILKGRTFRATPGEKIYIASTAAIYELMSYRYMDR